MGLFNFFRTPDINEGVKEFNNTNKAVLIDVRTVGEYASGHIPKSRNVPLDNIGRIAAVVPDKHTPVFVYCLSGGRSNKATSFIKQMGYTNVTNIGGISAYKGKVER